jgi:hypothetical protein
MMTETLPTLTERQRTTVWNSWFGAEVRGLYFLGLCADYAQTQRMLTWATLAASSGATITLLGPDWLPPGLLWIRPALSAIAAGLTAWSLAHNYHARGDQCRDIGARWQRLATAFEHLWDDMYEADVAARLRTLQAEEGEASKASSSFKTDPKRMRRCFDTVMIQRGPSTSTHPATAA